MRFGKRSGTIAAVVTGATLVPLVAFGGVGLAKNSPSGSQYQYPGANQYKVTICHHTHSKKHPTHTITISKSALPAHLRHGDTLGACPAPAPVSATTTTTPKHANNGHHGKP
jgi:hypothetical protein